MRRQTLLVGLLSLPTISATAFGGCGDDEAIAPPPLDASAQGDPKVADGGFDAGPPTERSSCIAYVEAFCAKDVACNPSQSGTTQERCRQVADLCPEYFFSAGSTRTIESMVACAAEFPKVPCEAWSAGIRPTCQSAGTLPAGSPCISPAQCASLSCDGLFLGTRCGNCAALYAADQECTGSGDFGPIVCPFNQRCDATTKRCAPIVPLTVLAVGAPCAPTNASQVCPTGTTCLTTSGDAGATTGACSTLPSAGNPCARAPGASDVNCAKGAYCTKTTSLSGTCSANAKAGEDCGPAANSTFIQCESGLYCSAAKCKAHEALDAPCAQRDACGPNAYCRYSAPNVGTCRPPAAPGEACGIVAYDGGATNVPCASKDCRATADGGATCRAPPTVGRGGDCSAPTAACHRVLTCNRGICSAIDHASCIADAADGG